MAIPRNLANLANQLNTDGEAPKIEVGNSSVVVTDTGSNGTIAFTTDGNERMRITNAGQVLVGATTARSDFFNTTTVIPAFQVELAASNNLNRFISVTSNNSDTGGANLFLAKSRGTTVGAVTIVQNDDQIGAVSFQGADGVDMVEGARIEAKVDGTPGSNDMPGRLAFYTTADGSASSTERARITSAGNLLVGTTSTTANGGVLQVSNGITFPATQSACSDVNTLDDYEEGTFTPTITYSTPGTLSVGYSTQSGTYVKIGRLVYVEIVVILSSFTKGTASGALFVAGLPFAGASTQEQAFNYNFYSTPLPTGAGQFPVVSIANTETRANLSYVSDNTTGFNFPDPDSNAQYKINGCYRTS